MKKSAFFWILIFVLVVIFAFLVLKPANQSKFESSLNLSKYQNKLVVLHFWSSWCHFCVQEAPGFAQTWRKFENNKKIAFVGVDSNDEKKDGLEFIKKYDFGFENIFDPQGKIYGEYKLSGVPTTFFIRNSKIIETFPGAMEQKFLEQKILTYLGND